ncbi:hypothetical protein MOQ_000205 [Trypanosoma cruzi marinkellei]|uniref:F-box domain-containing protein n=1 Tax=Trypanosoma cruzi marinkellei TaxID=85056 RepID=K2NWZ3_TRYCR|nr:hypothetical protein MOQ_000205 [Trypanosoma cruzi marinkellei]
MKRRTTRFERRMRTIHIGGGTFEGLPRAARGPWGRMGNKEIRDCMFHLVAEAASKYIREGYSMLSSERLAAEMGLADMKRVTLSLTEPLKTVADAETSLSSAGDSDSFTERVKNPFQGKKEAKRAFSSVLLQNDILLRVLSFLSWRCVLQVRGVNKQFLFLSFSFVTVCRIPYSEIPGLFIPCHEDLMMNERKLEAQLAPARGLCACLEYGPMPGSPLTCSKSCSECSSFSDKRMFIGQLRRDGTVPMIKWLLLTVLQLPPKSFVSVENHRNRTSKRGKGCVWLTLRDDATKVLLSYHHRVFFDSVRNVEGVWLVPPRCREQLAALANTRGALIERSKHLPRGTLVVEMPNSVFSTITASTTQSFLSTKQTSASPFPSPPPPVPFSNLQACRKLRGMWRYDPYSFTSPVSYIIPH